MVGVNTAILSPSGGSVGIGFAIPSDMVRTVVQQIEKNGHVTRGYLGVEMQPINASMAAALKLPKLRTGMRALWWPASSRTRRRPMPGCSPAT